MKRDLLSTLIETAEDLSGKDRKDLVKDLVTMVKPKPKKTAAEKVKSAIEVVQSCKQYYDEMSPESKTLVLSIAKKLITRR